MFLIFEEIIILELKSFLPSDKYGFYYEAPSKPEIRYVNVRNITHFTANIYYLLII